VEYTGGAEPLFWLQPGGSGRDHRPLCAALATEATPSAPSGSTGRPLRKRPALTRGSLGRPPKGGRQAPASRGLVGDGLRVRRLQGGLPPRPGTVRLARIEQGSLGIHEACQISAEEIALGAGPTLLARVPALGARFLLDPATVARLAQLGPLGVDGNTGRASTSSQARQPLNKYPWGTQLD
jgi:hypothetical protein